jgi:UDP-N-acetylmuramoyl-L-alanyl-D-glutamate--2,6-diaminopimelate ligase
MQALKDILYGINIKSVVGDMSTTVNHLTFDSRTVTPDSIFFAIVGVASNGHDFIDHVIEAGCKSIIVSQDTKAIEGVNIIQVENTKKALALAASNFYGEPSKELKLIGITGTNGKTTIATLLYN